ncbi:MAG: hypothetical protein HC884_03970 [Chloroflexaceae bacterium]|nr:hypothetical protein [Chloroflexaceae bacterium]
MLRGGSIAADAPHGQVGPEGSLLGGKAERLQRRCHSLLKVVQLRKATLNPHPDSLRAFHVGEGSHPLQMEPGQRKPPRWLQCCHQQGNKRFLYFTEELQRQVAGRRRNPFDGMGPAPRRQR